MEKNSIDFFGLFLHKTCPTQYENAVIERKKHKFTKNNGAVPKRMRHLLNMNKNVGTEKIY